MKAPLCPKCETLHYSTQRCPADGKAAALKTKERRPTSAVVSGAMPDMHRPGQSGCGQDEAAHLPVRTPTSDGPTTGMAVERSEKLKAKPTELVMPAFSSEQDVEDARKLVSALTPAEKQRAYRERLGDEGRKRDRERKARKHDV